jgi:photosystem II stability/assembly factor-like uncharacterized protein
MSTVDASSRVLFDALGSFWHRLFADKGQLVALYQGTEEQLGQAYLDTLETVLCRTIATTPLFHKEHWKSVVLREEARIEPPVGYAIAWELDAPLTGAKLLQNNILNPALVFEEGDFAFSRDGTTYSVAFKTDISATAGIPKRTVDVVSKKLKAGVEGTVTDATTFTCTGAFNPLYAGAKLKVGSPAFPGEYTIAAATEDTLTVSPAFPSAGPVGKLSWEVWSKSTGYRLSLWAAEVAVERNYLADTYGTLISEVRPSSETYRSLIRGVFQYFVLGAALKRLEAALNVIHGIPVAQVDGEAITAINANVITTDIGEYTIVPATVVRTDLVVGQTLRAFEPLSVAFEVVDYLSNPTWWWDIAIPEDALRTIERAGGAGREQVSTALSYLTYGSDEPADATDYYGDPELYYGAHYDGSVSADPESAGMHHSFAYNLMNTYLKYHMFGVFPHNDILGAGVDVDETAALVKSGMPSYLFPCVPALTYVPPPPPPPPPPPEEHVVTPNTWAQFTPPAPVYEAAGVMATPTGAILVSGYGWDADFNSDTKAIWRFDSATTTWTNVFVDTNYERYRTGARNPTTGTICLPGSGGTHIVRSTNDGVSFTEVFTNNGTSGMYAIACDGVSKWVAVGDFGTVLYSTNDGLTWQWANGVDGSIVPAPKPDLRGVLWDGTQWVVLGKRFDNPGVHGHLYTSATLPGTWVDQGAMEYNAPSDFATLAFTGTKYAVALNVFGTGHIFTASSVAGPWTQATIDVPFQSFENVHFLSYSEEKGMLYGVTNMGRFVYSGNSGLNWSIESIVSAVELNGITWAGDRWVTVGPEDNWDDTLNPQMWQGIPDAP